MPNPLIRVSSTSPGATPTMGPSAPQCRVERVPEARHARTERHRLAAPLHRHPAQAQIQRIELARLCPEHEQSRRCVVGDGIEELDIPRRDAAAHDLDRRQCVSHRRDHICEGGVGVREIAFEHERDFRFDLGLQHLSQLHFLAVVQRHVGEEHAEIRRLDPKLLLYRLGSETDLAAHEPSPLVVIVVGFGLLHRVSGRHATVPKLVADRRNRDARFRRLAKARGDTIDHLCVDAHSASDSAKSEATGSGGIFASVSRSAMSSTALQLPDDCAYSPY